MKKLKLQELSKHYLAIRGSKNDAIITSDKSKTILSWNKGAENLFGYSEDEILGKPISIIIPIHLRKYHDEGMENVINGNEPRVMGNALEVTGLHKSGNEFPIELTLGHYIENGEIFF
ncbi:PAS domain S-box protein [Leptospira limi]|uniref:PAS domain S-box protein n=1 Tax=Leptospira limi TaxID=2950023 RepID=A0ABT3M0C3_9LEPT|nr:PAS domain S-box protein [Leptospira limi]MCW7463425.1 PAS domain S-box protein [Leptospira limi]